MTSGDYTVAEFVCAQCGNCCRGKGYVRVSPAEIKRMAAHLGISETDFEHSYCREPEIPEHIAAGHQWLRDKPGPDLECVFLENNRCRVYPVKPDRCTGFPLQWRTPAMLAECEGMKRT